MKFSYHSQKKLGFEVKRWKIVSKRVSVRVKSTRFSDVVGFSLIEESEKAFAIIGGKIDMLRTEPSLFTPLAF